MLSSFVGYSKSKENLERLFHVEQSFPFFAGHFPGAPLVPGAVILGWMMESVQLMQNDPVTHIRVIQLKLINPIFPDSLVKIEITQSDNHRNCKVSCGEKLCASATLLIAPYD